MSRSPDAPPSLLHIVDQDYIAAYRSPCQEQLLAGTRPGEIEDGAVSEVCDPISANPFGNYAGCLNYSLYIPMNAPTPCDNYTRNNFVGDSIVCRSEGIMAGYNVEYVGDTAALAEQVRLPRADYVIIFTNPHSVSCGPSVVSPQHPAPESNRTPRLISSAGMEWRDCST